MNNINREQNSDEILMLLYSSRINYNVVEKLKYTVWILCILNIIIATFTNNSIYIMNIAVILIAIFMTIMEYCINKYTNIASNMRRLVDYKLFKFEYDKIQFNENYLLTKAKDKVKRNNKSYSLSKENTGTDPHRGVKDWYTGINCDLSHDEAVIKCQKQNVYWDKNLCSIVIKSIVIVFFLIIISYLIINRENTIEDIIKSMVYLVPLIVKLIHELIIICNYKSTSKGIDALIENIDYNQNPINLRLLQSKIDKRRSINFIVPDILHKLNSANYHNQLSCD
ncbi:MAG: S-4TM family putative pore-forming effector [Clostridia bacterium]|nr:S-4TM family putative pore-forming effector [Clostridia bacterium]